MTTPLLFAPDPRGIDPRGSDPIPVLPAAVILVLVAVGLIWLAGCVVTQPASSGVRTVEVAMPVPVPCPDPPEVELPEPPRLPIEGITDESSEADVVKAYAATVRILVTDNIALRLLVRSLLSPTPPSPPLQPAKVPNE